MNRFSRELIESLIQAVEHAEGKTGCVRVSVIDIANDVVDPEPNRSRNAPPTPRRRIG